MDLLIQVLDYIVDDDTAIVDLLPLVVLGFVVIGIRYLRSLLLRVLVEIGALREHIKLSEKLDRIVNPSDTERR